MGSGDGAGVAGQVRDVLLLPSVGRPASDFAHLAADLAAAGLRPLAIDPPTSLPAGATLHHLADDVIARADDAGVARFHLVGHAFGNRVARTVAADHPSRVSSLVLLACGGMVPLDPAVAESLRACFDPALDDTERLRHVAAAFFAPGNDPSAWLGGWSAGVAALQAQCSAATDRADWWDATAERVLVIQGLQDVCAVPANGRRYVADHADVARLVELDGAGHALLPERPDVISEALVAFFSAPGSSGDPDDARLSHPTAGRSLPDAVREGEA